MTTNRARKHAARQRAAVTGERYVVAQRAIAETRPQGPRRMHDLMHEVPGVPPHIDGGLQGTPRGRTSKPRSQNRRRNQPRVHNEPRVLVGWQNRIARLFGAK